MGKYLVFYTGRKYYLQIKEKSDIRFLTSLFKDLFCILKIRVKFRERIFPSTCSFPKWPQLLGVRQAKIRKLRLHFKVSYEVHGPQSQAIFHCFPRGISRELGQKCSWYWGWHSYEIPASRQHKLPCHDLVPQIINFI